jgi:hypothetical protein
MQAFNDIKIYETRTNNFYKANIILNFDFDIIVI